MRRLFTSKRLLLAATLVLLIASLLSDRAARGVSAPLHAALELLLSPFTHPLQRIAAAVRRPPSPTPPEAELLIQENERLWLRMRQLEEDLDKAHQSLDQLSQLPSELRRPQTDLLVASVTNWDPAIPSLTINRGQRHGLRPGLAVVDGVNLVGQVAATTPATATVRLLTAPRTFVKVRFVRPGMISEQGELVLVAESLPDRSGFAVPFEGAAPFDVGDLAYVYDDPRWDAASGSVVGAVARIEPLPSAPPFRPRAIIESQTTPAALPRVVVLIPRERR